MGGKQTKAAEMLAKQTNAKLKKPARMPKGMDSLSGKIHSNYIQAQYTHLRQIEKEFEKQIKKPTPAPRRTHITGRPDHADSLSDAVKQEKIDFAKQADIDETLAQRLRKVGQLTDNIKDSPEDEIKITGAPADTQQAAYQTKENQNIRGRVPSYEQVNVISNHRDNPIEWSVPNISKLLGLREPDVGHMVKYYGLIDEKEVKFVEPKQMRWSEAHSRWFVGEPLPQDPTLEDFKDNWKNEKPLIGHTEVRKLLKMHRNADPKYSYEHIVTLQKHYYIPADIYDELRSPMNPADRLTLTGEKVSKSELGISDGEISLHKFIENIEKSPTIAAGETPPHAQLADPTQATPQLETSNMIQHETQVKRKPGSLNDAVESVKSAKPRRFDDDASYDPRFSQSTQ